MNRALRILLTWAAIAGGALTIAHHWSNYLNITDDVQLVLDHWEMMLHEFWSQLSGLFSLELGLNFDLTISLICFYLIISIASIDGHQPEDSTASSNGRFNLSMIYLTMIAVVTTSTFAAFIADYYVPFIIFDNIIVCLAFTYIIDGNITTRIIGGIAYTAVYTVLDDYIKSMISPDKSVLAAAVSAQLIAVFVIFLPLIFGSSTLLTRRISKMLLCAGIIVGFGTGVRLFKDLRTDAQY